MPPFKPAFSLRFKGKVYAIVPDFSLMREIEHELGPAPYLLHRFLTKQWKVSELVTLVQMLLQSAGETVDYCDLGNAILKEGVQKHLVSAQSFLRSVLCQEQEEAA